MLDTCEEEEPCLVDITKGKELLTLSNPIEEWQKLMKIGDKLISLGDGDDVVAE